MSRFIGNVSAYAYAVSKGYTGTEEEFAELMASYAEVGQTAVDAKDAAVAAKTAAQTAATTATNKASEATTAAQTATTKAGEAQTSAQTASSKASEASQSAQTASAKASESAQSASQALTYKTDAESAKTASQTAQGLAESARDSAISAKNDAESARDEAQNIVDGISAKAEQIDANTASIASLTKDKAPVITDTASGSIASFTDGADNLPLKSLVVDINPIQDLSHGDPSPENICPISGWTQVNVNHSDADMTNPTTLTISLGQTVYGARIDVLSGVMRVEKAKVTFDGSEAWVKNADVNALFTLHLNYPSLVNLADSKDDNVRVISDKLIGTSGRIATTAASRKGYQIAVISASRFYVVMPQTKEPYITSADDFKAWLANNPITVCYELATPIEIQLTPQQVNSLLGVNNIWADTGDTEVEYRADTRLYIEKLTQPEEDDMIADSAITSGQFFMIGNSLYRALADIASGATITVGTNAQRVSLSDALNLVNS